MIASEANQPGQIRLLLVDDEKEYVNVLSKRMAKRNIFVVPCHSGSEAIRIFRSQDFDMVILDLKMEDMDGIDVLRIFKKMDPAVPVIMLTGHGSEQAAREGVELGAFDYLLKPCDFDELVKKVIRM
jgi:DNA-binding response OmpR family regulator